MKNLQWTTTLSKTTPNYKLITSSRSRRSEGFPFLSFFVSFFVRKKEQRIFRWRNFGIFMIKGGSRLRWEREREKMSHSFLCFIVSRKKSRLTESFTFFSKSHCAKSAARHSPEPSEWEKQRGMKGEVIFLICWWSSSSLPACFYAVMQRNPVNTVFNFALTDTRKSAEFSASLCTVRLLTYPAVLYCTV